MIMWRLCFFFWTNTLLTILFDVGYYTSSQFKHNLHKNTCSLSHNYHIFIIKSTYKTYKQHYTFPSKPFFMFYLYGRYNYIKGIQAVLTIQYNEEYAYNGMNLGFPKVLSFKFKAWWQKHWPHQKFVSYKRIYKIFILEASIWLQQSLKKWSTLKAPSPSWLKTEMFENFLLLSYTPVGVTGLYNEIVILWL